MKILIAGIHTFVASDDIYLRFSPVTLNTDPDFQIVCEAPTSSCRPQLSVQNSTGKQIS